MVVLLKFADDSAEEILSSGAEIGVLHQKSRRSNVALFHQPNIPDVRHILDKAVCEIKQDDPPPEHTGARPNTE